MAGMIKAMLQRPRAPLGVNRTLSLSWIRKRVLTISPQETSFSRRGFHCSDQLARQHLEQVGKSFLLGYNAALDHKEVYSLADDLNKGGMGLEGGVSVHRGGEKIEVHLL